MVLQGLPSWCLSSVFVLPASPEPILIKAAREKLRKYEPDHIALVLITLVGPISSLRPGVLTLTCRAPGLLVTSLLILAPSASAALPSRP